VKVFISSVITGFEAFRAAAAAAAKTLKIQVLRAEDFGASADSPRRVCLAGVRAADVVLLIIGARYGEIDPRSGLSPTHEEFSEARERSRVLVFVQEGVTREPSQEKFLREVRDWATGQYTASFTTPDELRDAIIGALHELELAQHSGGVDAEELTRRAASHVPDDGRGAGSSSVSVIVVGAPNQQIVRPADLEKTTFAKEVIQSALFGAEPVFSTASGTQHRVRGDALVIEQEDASILLNQLGDIRITQPVSESEDERSSYLPVLVEEEILARILSALRFASSLLDRIDPPGRLARVAVIASLSGAGHMGWMTRAQRRRRPNSVEMSMRGSNSIVAALSPAVRPRAALRADAARLAEDLMVMLRREQRS
jgi:hypothetical protein